MLAAFSLTIYQLTRSNLLGWVEQDVRHQATLLRATIHPCPGAATLCVPPLDVFHSPEIYLQVQDPQGTVMASSGNLGKHRLPLIFAAIAADQVKEVPVDAMPLFVYGQPVVINHQLLGYLIVARSPQTIYYALTQLNHLFYLMVIAASSCFPASETYPVRIGQVLLIKSQNAPHLPGCYLKLRFS